MRLPANQYLIFKSAEEYLQGVVPLSKDTCYITIDKFGDIYEHDDEIFDEGPLWFSYGTSRQIGRYGLEGGKFDDAVWHLLRRRVEP